MPEHQPLLLTGKAPSTLLDEACKFALIVLAGLLAHAQFPGATVHAGGIGAVSWFNAACILVVAAATTALFKRLLTPLFYVSTALGALAIVGACATLLAVYLLGPREHAAAIHERVLAALDRLVGTANTS
ncbi:MAG: hypothetical protein Q7V62_17025 [Actinomycetota bacterium]|nr:hypothetical protein [Actinomycetota bacterium]